MMASTWRALASVASMDEPTGVLKLTVVSEKSALGTNSVPRDRKSTRLNSSHSQISYAVFCLKKKKRKTFVIPPRSDNTLKSSDGYPIDPSSHTPFKLCPPRSHAYSFRYSMQNLPLAPLRSMC